jgi:hypothetical protein
MLFANMCRRSHVLHINFLLFLRAMGMSIKRNALPDLEYLIPSVQSALKTLREYAL